MYQTFSYFYKLCWLLFHPPICYIYLLHPLFSLSLGVPFTGGPITAIDCGLLQFASRGRALSQGSKALLRPSIITDGFHRGHRGLMNLHPFKVLFERFFQCLTLLWPGQVKTSGLSGCSSSSRETCSRKETGADVWHSVKGVMHCGPCRWTWVFNDLPGSGL